jgi:GntR family transcriptional regulator
MVDLTTTEDDSSLTKGSASIHQQLAERLRAQVSQMAPDSQMPTEKELVDRYGVSRTTVRRALRGLVDEGLLVRRQGAGTFVAPRRIVHPLDQLRPFISIFASIGKRPEGKVLRFEWVTEPQLEPQTDQPVDGALLIRRLYTIDGAPQAVADIAVPDPFGQRISRAEIEEHPIYQVLQDNLGLTLSYGRIRLTSQGAPEDLAKPLDVSTGHPLLVLQRATMDADDRLLEHATYYLLPDRFELRLTVDATELEKVSYSFSRPGPELVMVPPA